MRVGTSEAGALLAPVEAVTIRCYRSLLLYVKNRRSAFCLFTVNPDQK